MRIRSGNVLTRNFFHDIAAILFNCFSTDIQVQSNDFVRMARSHMTQHIHFAGVSAPLDDPARVSRVAAAFGTRQTPAGFPWHQSDLPLQRYSLELSRIEGQALSVPLSQRHLQTPVRMCPHKINQFRFATEAGGRLTHRHHIVKSTKSYGGFPTSG